MQRGKKYGRKIKDLLRSAAWDKQKKLTRWMKKGEICERERERERQEGRRAEKEGKEGIAGKSRQTFSAR